MKNTFLTILLILILATNTLLAQKINTETIYFDFNKYELSENAKIQLNKSCEKIRDNQLLQITLTGHTDADGSNEYNLTLSKNRTNAVSNYLISKGINSEKIKIEFFGEDKPIAQNDNKQGKQQNRRVEIIIDNKELITGDIFSKLKKESQFFKAIAGEDVIIKGNEGTEIKIFKGSLVKKNGEIVTGEIEIELKEFYKKADIISSNLHTMSNKEILETGGMIFLSATNSGEILKLKKEVEIEFVSKNKIQGMETFNGEMKDNQVNWVNKSNSIQVVTKTRDRDISIFEERYYDGYPKDGVVNKELSKVDKMILKSGDLGWINCDRFYKFEYKTDLIVEMDTAFRPVVRLVFKDINAIMPGYYSKESKIIFNGIPVGQKATLIAFSLVNDEPYYVSKDIIISKDQKEIMTLIKTTMTGLMDELKNLN